MLTGASRVCRSTALPHGPLSSNKTLFYWIEVEDAHFMRLTATSTWTMDGSHMMPWWSLIQLTYSSHQSLMPLNCLEKHHYHLLELPSSRVSTAAHVTWQGLPLDRQHGVSCAFGITFSGHSRRSAAIRWSSLVANATQSLTKCCQHRQI